MGTPYCLEVLWNFLRLFTLPSPTPAFHVLPHFHPFSSSADSPHASPRKLKPSGGHAFFSLANQKLPVSLHILSAFPPNLSAHAALLLKGLAQTIWPCSSFMNNVSLLEFSTGNIILRKKQTFLTFTSTISSLPFNAKPTNSCQWSLSLLFLLFCPPLKTTFSMSITLLSLNSLVPMLLVTFDRKEHCFHLYAFSLFVLFFFPTV